MELRFTWVIVRRASQVPIRSSFGTGLRCICNIHMQASQNEASFGNLGTCSDDKRMAKLPIKDAMLQGPK